MYLHCVRRFAPIAWLACSASLGQTWSQLPDFPGTARDDAASFVIDTSVYVGTGREVGWALTNDWYRFDVTTLEWTAIAPLPATPRQYCSGFSVDGRGYLFGGQDANGPLNELWEYDPSTDSWTEKSPMPATGRYACVGAGSMYPAKGLILTGMLANDVPTREVWSYLPSDDQWTRLSDIPGMARHRACAFLFNGKIHLFGGADSSFNALAEHLVLDLGTDAWDTQPPLPAPRFEARTWPGVVIGGAASTNAVEDNLWSYDLLDMTWSSLSPLPFGPRRGGVSEWTMWDEGALAFYGTGLDDQFERHNDWWMVATGGGIAEEELGEISVSPDPGTDGFRLDGLPTDPRLLRVVDVQGRAMLNRHAPLPTFINAEAWDSGMYIVLVTDRSGRTLHAKWVKR